MYHLRQKLINLQLLIGKISNFLEISRLNWMNYHISIWTSWNCPRKRKNSLFFSLCATKKISSSLDRVAWVPFPDLEVIVDLDLVQDLETIVVVEEAQMTGEEACLTLTRESGLQMHQGNIFKLFLIEIGLKPEMETIETGNCSWLKPKSSCFVASPIHCLLPLQRLKVTSF